MPTLVTLYGHWADWLATDRTLRFGQYVMLREPSLPWPNPPLFYETNAEKAFETICGMLMAG